jgi:hypothetical protein
MPATFGIPETVIVGMARSYRRMTCFTKHAGMTDKKTGKIF